MNIFAAETIESTFLQAGIAGAVALLFAGVAARLFTQLQGSNQAAMAQLKETHAAEISRMEATHKAAVERLDAARSAERLRADRIEAELRELNKLINEKLAGELVRASDTVRRALDNTHTERQY